MLHVGPGGPTPQQMSPVSHAGIVNLTEDRTLKPFEQYVRGSASTANPSFTVTLPPVASARGRIYTIMASIADAQAITVADQGDTDLADLTLDTDGDGVVLYSDGARWWVFSNEIA